MQQDIYDSIIIGAGPAGLASAIYNARDRFKTLVLEKLFPGGQIATTDRIENYPGFAKISGPDLIEKMMTQAQNFGAEIKTSAEVKSIEKLADGNIKVNLKDKHFITKAVILAPGSSYRKLGVPGEEIFRNAGAGVSYCGTCDAPFFKDKKVVAVGGGNTAVEDTLHLANFAKEVILIHRRQQFRATPILVEELMTKVNQQNSNIKLKLDTVITEINGSEKVETVKIKNIKTQNTEDIACQGVFIFIGFVPNTDFLKGFVNLNQAGFIECDTGWLRTKVPGIFVAGDCRIAAAMQLATAIGDGVNAAMMLKQYLKDTNWWFSPIAGSAVPTKTPD